MLWWGGAGLETLVNGNVTGLLELDRDEGGLGHVLEDVHGLTAAICGP